jgi:hypothetical protein
VGACFLRASAPNSIPQIPSDPSRGLLFHPDRKSFFVTHWADGTLGEYDAASGIPMGQAVAHP